MFASEASYVYKKISLQKIAFLAFFPKLQKWKRLFKAAFLHLLNKLLHKIMEQSCFKKQFSN